MPKTVNLRDMPEDLVRQAKACAALNGVSLKAFVIRAMEQALTNQSAAPVPPGKKDKKDKKRKKDRKKDRKALFRLDAVD